MPAFKPYEYESESVLDEVPDNDLELASFVAVENCAVPGRALHDCRESADGPAQCNTIPWRAQRRALMRDALSCDQTLFWRR